MAKTLSLNKTPQGCTLTLRSLVHAFHHAVGLVAIITNTILPKDGTGISPLFGHTLVWLLDGLPSLTSLLNAWPTPLELGPTPVIRTAVALTSAQSTANGINLLLSQKTYAMLVAVCHEILERPHRLLAEDADGLTTREVVCSGLVELCKGAMLYRPTLSLVVSRLVGKAQRLTSENGIIGPDTDAGVSHWVADCTLSEQNTNLRNSGRCNCSSWSPAIPLPQW